MDYTELYLEADPKIIREVVLLLRERIGEGVNIIDLKPRFKYVDDFGEEHII